MVLLVQLPISEKNVLQFTKVVEGPVIHVALLKTGVPPIPPICACMNGMSVVNKVKTKGRENIAVFDLEGEASGMDGRKMCEMFSIRVMAGMREKDRWELEWRLGWKW